MTKVEYKHTEVVAKKKLGQNFLTDRNITRNIVEASGASPGEAVLEIGPGFGALTSQIAAVVPDFTVVEKDPVLADFIRHEFPQVRVVEGDFLKVDLEELSGGRPLRVLGNIPYSITSPILFRLLENRDRLLSATLMMQHEVARRLVALPSTKEYGILAVQMQAFCRVDYLFKVGRKVFRPQPQVDSAVIRMVPRSDSPVTDPAGFSRFVRRAFAQRRKTLLNNLRNDYDLSAVPEATLKLRAEALDIPALLELFGLLKPL